MGDETRIEKIKKLYEKLGLMSLQDYAKYCMENKLQYVNNFSHDYFDTYLFERGTGRTTFIIVSTLVDFIERPLDVYFKANNHSMARVMKEIFIRYCNVLGINFETKKLHDVFNGYNEKEFYVCQDHFVKITN